MSDVTAAIIARMRALEARLAALERRELNLPAGTASLPAVRLAGDSNTGIWQSAADNLDFSTGGTNRLNISSAGLGVTGAITVSGAVNGVVQGGIATTIADDAAYSFTPTTSGVGTLLLSSNSESALWAIVHYSTSATYAFCVSIAAGATVNVATGALAGTTGTDAKFTISAHTDGKIYLENRRGGARGARCVYFGGS